MTAALAGGEWSAARPGSTLPPGKTRYPFYRRLCGPQGRSGRAEKSRPHRDSIPDHPAHSQSLYRLSYPAHRSICIFLFNRTLQVFVTYLIGALYVHALWFCKHQQDNLKCIVYDKLLKPWQSLRITLYLIYDTRICLSYSEAMEGKSCEW